MKRSTLILIVLVLGLAVGDFIAAPMTGMGLLKRTIGAQLVMLEVKAAFRSKGEGIEGADGYCQQPQEKLGYWYKCAVRVYYDHGGQYRKVEVTIDAYDPVPTGYQVTLLNRPLQ